MTQKEAQVLILTDLITHFNSGNRSLKNGWCAYNGDNGRHCIAGRWMKDPSKARENESISTKANKPLLKKEAQIAGTGFLRQLQYVHDDATNWNKKGLSHLGKKAVNYLIKEYNLPMELL